MPIPTKLERVVANCKELKTLYIYYHNAFDQQTLQRNDLGRGSSAHKDTWPYDQVTNLRSRDQFKKFYVYFHKTYSPQTRHGGDLNEGPESPNQMTL